MAKTDVIKQATLMGQKVTLYANRIEIEKSRFPFGTSRETILLRNVTDISKGLATQLTLTTTDGKKHKLPLGGDFKAWQDAISAQL